MNNFYKICKNILLENDQFDQDKQIASTIMDDPTSAHIAHLTRLSDHPNFDIKKAVGANPNTPPSVLHKMTLDPKVDVQTRAEIAKNPAIGSETFKWFLNNNVHLDHILNNPAVPLLHLEDPELFNDVKNSNVVHGMMKTDPNYAQFLLNSKRWDVRRATLMHPDLPHHIIQSYYNQKSDARKKEDILNNKSKFKRIESSLNVTPLAYNSNTPDHILKAMLDDYDDLTNIEKSAIYQHPNFSDQNLDKEVIKNPAALDLFIEHPRAARYERRILSRNASHRTQENYIHYNPAVTTDRLIQLGNHPDPVVARIARGRYDHPDNEGNA